jgi:hypothetical protein
MGDPQAHRDGDREPQKDEDELLQVPSIYTLFNIAQSLLTVKGIHTIAFNLPRLVIYYNVTYTSVRVVISASGDHVTKLRHTASTD